MYQDTIGNFARPNCVPQPSDRIKKAQFQGLMNTSGRGEFVNKRWSLGRG